jgi:hypothetical protein
VIAGQDDLRYSGHDKLKQLREVALRRVDEECLRFSLCEGAPFCEEVNARLEYALEGSHWEPTGLGTSIVITDLSTAKPVAA